jgi:hypothetical protein
MNLSNFYTGLLGLPADYYGVVKRLCSGESGYIDAAQHGFLAGVAAAEAAATPQITVGAGDVRVDAPVWFGNPATAQRTIMIVGMEPRHSDDRYNLRREGATVYASPFGADRWCAGSSNKYYTVLQQLLPPCFPDLCVVLTDLVKAYQVLDPDHKQDNDRLARQSFRDRFTDQGQTQFAEEVHCIQPDLVLAFGRATTIQLGRYCGERLPVLSVRHPAYGGVNQAKTQLAGLCRLMKGTRN